MGASHRNFLGWEIYLIIAYQWDMLNNSKENWKCGIWETHPTLFFKNNWMMEEANFTQIMTRISISCFYQEKATEKLPSWSIAAVPFIMDPMTICPMSPERVILSFQNIVLTQALEKLLKFWKLKSTKLSKSRLLSQKKITLDSLMNFTLLLTKSIV